MTAARAMALVFGLAALGACHNCQAAETAPAGSASFEALGERYRETIRPLLTQFCLDCHSASKQEGELDLERFTTIADVRRDARAWQKVVEMLDNGEMPPKDSPQPMADERRALREWAARYLDAEALANAGDPGSVVLRRLSNVEFDNSVRDLTGVDLRPSREFPADSAAGEGFTNVGEALVMSPAMLDKYVAAAKEIAAHAVLLPDGFRFSRTATRRDWTDELLTRIRELYSRQTVAAGARNVTLQGLNFEAEAGGRIPLEAYLAATIAHRDAVKAGPRAIAATAAERQLNEKYLQTMWDLFDEPSGAESQASPLLGQLRTRWRSAGAADVAALAEEIRLWQAALTKFNSVAHFKTWQEGVDPIIPSRSLRFKLAPPAEAKEVVLRLTTRDAGDGSEGDVVEWRLPRLEAPGRPPLYLRDLRDGLRSLAEKRRETLLAAKYLAAVDLVRTLPATVDIGGLAKERGLDPALLAAWLTYTGIGGQGELKIDKLFVERLEKNGGYDFVQGWGVPETPIVIANSSDQQVRVPGIARPHTVLVHPSPTRNVAAGWRSPLAGEVKIEAHSLHAHPECGNGLVWALELRRGGERRRLSSGEINNGQQATIPPVDKIAVLEGDLISLLIGPRGGDHSCDLTEVDLTVGELGGSERKWNLARDVSGDILAGNPHADSLGNREVWHFYHEAIDGKNDTGFGAIPPGSLLERWRDEPQPDKRQELAAELERLLAAPPAATETPDGALQRVLVALNGPLLGRLDFTALAADAQGAPAETPDGAENVFGLPRDAFGKSPASNPADSASLFVAAPGTVEIRLPAEVAAGREFAVEAALFGDAGSVQADVVVDGPAVEGRLVAGSPVIARNGSDAKARLEKSFGEFRRVFPAALCYTKIVPVDEVVTLVLFHREDEELARLFLDGQDRERLDRLWEELRFIGQDALKVQEAYGQFMEYVTQDGDVRVFEPLRKPITERAAAFRQSLLDAEPKQLDALVAFAARAWRRPLALPAEEAGLRALYAKLRVQGLDHEAAFRLTLTRVFMSPWFLYRAEQPSAGPTAQPVSDWELASRLSYFLWSSTPDEELTRLAAEEKLHQPEVLAAQMRRMLQDPRARSLATEFACQWLDVRGFDSHNEKSEQTFPEFAALRGAMYEEPVRFFVDMFANDGSILETLDADHTFLDEDLARHYGIPGVTGPEWRRVEGVRAHGRGGAMGMAALLAKHSGASRTSPILRGNWLVETMLGEKLPKPPKNVPLLPESELDTDGLTMRELTEKHRVIESCAKCHERIDPYGFALEGFDAIGRRRQNDLAGRPIDTRAELKNGARFDGLPGLREYVLSERRDEFLRQFCRKLLGFALGRSVQLSDDPLLAEMQTRLAQNDYRVQTALLAVVESPQFNLRRGLNSPLDADPAP